MSRIVIGIGHPHRGDDAAGLEVVKRVRSVPTRQSMTGTFEIIDMWEPFDDVIVVDASCTSAAPGTVLRIDAIEAPLPADTFVSTHVVGLVESIEMARCLGRLPDRLEVIGIEAGDVSLGASMSPHVAAAVARVAEEIDRA